MANGHRTMDRRGAELAGLILMAGMLDVAAGTGLSYVAGFTRMLSVLAHPSWPWLGAMAGALCLSFAGYYCACRGIYRAESGYDLPAGRLFAVVTAGFGGFFAHRGTTPDDLVLQQAGASRRESVVRAGTLGAMEQAVLALGGCGAAIAVLCLRLGAPPPNTTLPWAIIPVPAALIAFWAAGRYAPLLRDRTSRTSRTRWRSRVSTILDSVLLLGQLLRHPLRHAGAIGGMLAFWTAEIFAVWAGLAAFGLRMDGAALITGFCTGMIATRRVAPLAGAGILTVILPLAVWYSGAPFTIAIAGIFAYRALTLWLPMPFALAALPALRRIGKQAIARSVGDPGDIPAAA